ncbi:MAG: thiosulfate oxidation carrier protein SoxY [Xanthobacteraceae bacterium]|nr:thiosulfate oxidation carrier protein SoxY [Xanthobacteraceae bacterium]
MRKLSRRQSFALFGWALAAMALLRASRAEAQGAAAEFLGGKIPASGKIEFDIPFTADNANSVPVGIRVDSPMTADNYCSEVLVIAEKNPRPKVCSFKFEPGLSVPHLSTRIRLAESQTVSVFAKMNDGSVFVARKAVTVTSGACAPGG